MAKGRFQYAHFIPISFEMRTYTFLDISLQQAADGKLVLPRRLTP
jgi:hypothetical protein